MFPGCEWETGTLHTVDWPYEESPEWETQPEVGVDDSHTHHNRGETPVCLFPYLKLLDSFEVWLWLETIWKGSELNDKRKFFLTITLVSGSL